MVLNKRIFKWVSVNEPTIFLNDEVSLSGVDNSHPEVEGRREKSSKKAIWLKILLGNIITTKSHHKEDSVVGCQIKSRCTSFGSL
jgi:hypothetical protein